MATYVTSPFYGNYDQFKAILEKTGFGKDDYLFILGNAIGDSSESMELLFDLMYRENIVLLLGSQEYYAKTILPLILGLSFDEPTEVYQSLEGESKELFGEWVKNGGYNFIRSFLELSAEQRADVIEYLSDLAPYDYYESKNMNMVFAYAMPNNFVPDSDPDDYDEKEFALGTVDYTKQYFAKSFLFSACTDTDKLGAGYGKFYNGKKHNISLATLGRDGGRASAFNLDKKSVIYAPFTEHLDI